MRILNYSNNAAEKFIATLRETDPIAYNVILSYIPQNNSVLSALGQNESNESKEVENGFDLWGAIGKGISTLWDKGTEYYGTKEAAKIAVTNADKLANAELLRTQAKIAADRAETDNIERLVALDRARIQNEKDKLKIKEQAGKMGLGALGLIGASILLFMFMGNARKR